MLHKTELWCCGRNLFFSFGYVWYISVCAFDVANIDIYVARVHFQYYDGASDERFPFGLPGASSTSSVYINSQ